MRILHIDTGRTMRGGQQLLLLTARGFRERGHEQTIACPPGSPLAKAAEEEGFPLIGIERGYWTGAYMVRRWRRTHKCDIVSAHDSRGQSISYLSTLGSGIVRVANRQVLFAGNNRMAHRWKYASTCDVVVTTSNAVRYAMVSQGVPVDHIEVIRGGIDFPARIAGPEGRARMREKWNLAPDDFVVGHVAAFTSEKGQADAVEALLRLLPGHANLKMILAGDGPLRNDPQLRARVQAAQGAAQLPGYIQPDAEFYAGLDLFLANSTSEALGLAPLYAMAHEVPVIASHVGGLPEVIGDAGWLIAPSNVDALTAAIADAIADPAQRIDLGRRAREHARGFSYETTIERTEALYDRLIKQRLNQNG
jgi:glycosyltransferase involved in cell wall biosynthesis